jgi:hypothetical protein
MEIPIKNALYFIGGSSNQSLVIPRIVVGVDLRAESLVDSPAASAILERLYHRLRRLGRRNHDE